MASSTRRAGKYPQTEPSACPPPPPPGLTRTTHHCYTLLYISPLLRVDTNGRLSVANGRVEVRALLPPPTFRVWPSSFVISDKNRRDTGECWPLTTEIDLYEVAGGFSGNNQVNTGLGLNYMCASYHWGNQCFVDLGASFTGCLTPAQLNYSTSFRAYIYGRGDTARESTNLQLPPPPPRA